MAHNATALIRLIPLLAVLASAAEPTCTEGSGCRVSDEAGEHAEEANFLQVLQQQAGAHHLVGSAAAYNGVGQFPYIPGLIPFIPVYAPGTDWADLERQRKEGLAKIDAADQELQNAHKHHMTLTLAIVNTGIGAMTLANYSLSGYHYHVPDVGTTFSSGQILFFQVYQNYLSTSGIRGWIHIRRAHSEIWTIGVQSFPMKNHLQGCTALRVDARKTSDTSAVLDNLCNATNTGIEQRGEYAAVVYPAQIN